MNSRKEQPVNLTAVPNKAERTRLVAGRLPSRVINVQEKAHLRLQKLLGQMFDQADDSLFEMADRAHSNHEQNIYFESMRELRIKRRGIELGFIQALHSAFLEIDEPAEVDSLAEEELDPSKLALVNENEIEEVVAVESMVSRCLAEQSDELALLSMRFDSLVGYVQISNDNNPLGPLPVSQSFASACEVLDVDIKARLLIFKLFEKHVICELGALYQTLNRDLAEEGVLPNITLSSRSNGAGAEASASAGTAARPGATSEGSAGHAGAANDMVFSELQHLLQNAGHLFSRQGQAGVGVGFGSEGEGGVATAGNDRPVRILRRAMILDLLSTMQTRVPGLATDHAGYAAEVPPKLDMRQLVCDMLNEGQEDGRYELGQVDEDAINLVNMLFQFVLEDNNLAVPLKSLLGLLQVPLAKVALLDKSFFGKNTHPARRLLNEMASASLGWVPANNSSRDFMYRKVKNTVERVLEEYEDDISVFQDTLADFLSFRESERRRSKVVEQRTLESEKGRAKAEGARSAVAEIIALETDGKPLPPVVSDLLQNSWSNVLFLICVREGSDSKSWKSAVRVMHELVWSVQEKSGEAERRRLMGLIPGLLKSLRTGLSRIGLGHFEMNQYFEELEIVHVGLMKREKPAAKTPASKDTAPAQADQLDQHDETAPEISGQSGGQTVDDMLSSSRLKIDTSIADSISRMSGTIQADADAPNDDLLEGDIDELMLSEVDKLTMGSWFEFSGEEETSFRCRLAAVIKPTGKYIFVNRSGKKVAELNRAQLASQVAQKMIKLLDDRLLFDRALESIIGQLKTAKA